MDNISSLSSILEHRFWDIKIPGGSEIREHLELDGITGVFYREENTFFFGICKEFEEPCNARVLYPSSPGRYFYLLRCLAIDETELYLQIRHEHDDVFAVKSISVLDSKNKISNDFLKYVITRLDLEGTSCKIKMDFEFKNTLELSFFYESCRENLPSWQRHEYRSLMNRIRNDDDGYGKEWEVMCFALMTIQWKERPYLPKDHGYAKDIAKRYLSRYKNAESELISKIDRAIGAHVPKAAYLATDPGEINAVFLENGRAEVCTLSTLVKAGCGEFKLLGGSSCANHYAEAGALIGAVCEGIDISQTDIMLFSNGLLTGQKNTIGVAAYMAVRSLASELSMKNCGFMGAMSLSSRIFSDYTNEEAEACLRAFVELGIKTVFAPAGMNKISCELDIADELIILEAESAEGLFEIAEVICSEEY